MRPNNRQTSGCFPIRLADMSLSSLKTASPARQEQAKLDIENAEDDLVQKTEVAITLMKTVLENVCTNYLHFFQRGANVSPSPNLSRT